MAFVELRNVSKEFGLPGGGRLRVLDGINLGVKKGEFVTIFGPNGCGKTTLLKLLAGFEKATGGRIAIGRREPEATKTYFVLQNPDESLFNWMTVRENVEVALGGEGSRQPGHARSILEEIRAGGKSLEDFSGYYPYQLSGGLKQLTVIARAFAFRPDFLLLDEPFSSLDFAAATGIQDTLLDMCRKRRQTVLFVSHDLDEAVYLADRIIVLSKQPAGIAGVIEVGLPRPRRQKMKLTPQFQMIKGAVIECFGGREWDAG